MTQDYTLLIVDDDEDDRYILKRLLKKTGLSLTILEASNGMEALDLLKKSVNDLQAIKPDAKPPLTLFLDINMPVMNGWSFLDALNQVYDDLEIKPTIVLMYTTSNTDDEKQKALDYPQVQRYITKASHDVNLLRDAILDSQQSV